MEISEGAAGSVTGLIMVVDVSGKETPLSLAVSASGVVFWTTTVSDLISFLASTILCDGTEDDEVLEGGLARVEV